MKKVVAGLGSLVLGIGLSQSASAQQVQPPPPAPEPQEAQPEPQEAQSQPAPPPPQAGAPTVYTYANGSWVYAADRGWVWVPAGATTTAVEGVPYAYLYTPVYGWTWYVSPWGWGAYRYGPWVAHPWHPVGWRGGWVARPHVVVRIGPHPVGHYHGYHFHRR